MTKFHPHTITHTHTRARTHADTHTHTHTHTFDTAAHARRRIGMSRRHATGTVIKAGAGIDELKLDFLPSACPFRACLVTLRRLGTSAKEKMLRALHRSKNCATSSPAGLDGRTCAKCRCATHQTMQHDSTALHAWERRLESTDTSDTKQAWKSQHFDCRGASMFSSRCARTWRCQKPFRLF